ncbi:MAG: hypothetical protein PSV17_06360 [Methylotenera sp.]|uniref:type IV pilus assembly protein FimV n=1 Tax=Methylotenera sp. TaxID=2051956 RepID=UPI00248A58D1|nr:hypothetical protein [Methylotenera sp.]MDI1309043.1 hypothetical protein [Methylotenera sp.]
MRFLALLTLFCYTNLSFALGLGDAELQSNLGEKFLVRVNVTDIEFLPDPICFTATDAGEAPAFKKASVSMRIINDNYQLTISTNDIITEPIVNLLVSFRCEPNVNREYVLLLDPAPIPTADRDSASYDNASILPNVNDTKKQTHTAVAKSSSTEGADSISEAAPEQITAKKVPKKKKPKKISSDDKKLKANNIGKQTPISTSSKATPKNRTNADETENKSTANKPLLVISAGNANVSEDKDKQGLSLRLATKMNVVGPDGLTVPPTATDTMDEMTVMSNRLAHLEKQITSLQVRNEQLVEDAQKAKENELFDWLKYLLIALGILITIALLEVLRRKLVNRPIIVKDSWFDEQTSNDTDNKLGANSANAFNDSLAIAQSFAEPNSNQPTVHHTSVNTQIITKTEKEEHGSIIEDADVFMEHGRPALAIQLLQSYLSDSPAESPAIWIKLLKLIAKEGTKSEYDSAVIECHQHFNIKTPEFGDDAPTADSSIEDFPDIVTRLEGVWGSLYAVGFLNDLIFNKRSQPREGFDLGAFNDLFFLRNIAKDLEYSHSTAFKSSSDQLRSNQTNISQAINANVAVTSSENTYFNEGLFTDINPLTDVQAEPKVEPHNAQPDTQTLLSSFNRETSYEVSIIPHDEMSSTFNSQEEALRFEVPDSVAISKHDQALFLAEEVNFNLLSPSESVEDSQGYQHDLLNEEIVLDDSENGLTDENGPLDFAIEFPDEDEQKAKSKAKTKSVKNQTETNEIEWDLPVIEPENKPKNKS